MRRKRQRKAIRKRDNQDKKHFEKSSRIKPLRNEESVLEEGQSEGLQQLKDLMEEKKEEMKTVRRGKFNTHLILIRSGEVVCSVGWIDLLNLHGLYYQLSHSGVWPLVLRRVHQ